MSERHVVIFITHDLAVARHVADRIGVMYQGRLIELGDAKAVVDNPLHPYSVALLAAAEELAAPPPQPGPFPPGGQPCQRHGTCDPADGACLDAEPVLLEAESRHFGAWHVAGGPRQDP